MEKTWEGNRPDPAWPDMGYAGEPIPLNQRNPAIWKEFRECENPACEHRAKRLEMCRRGGKYGHLYCPDCTMLAEQVETDLKRSFEEQFGVVRMLKTQEVQADLRWGLAIFTAIQFLCVYFLKWG